MAGPTRTEAVYLYPHKTTTLAALGTLVPDPYIQVIRVTASVATTLTWTTAPNAPVMPILANVEHYFRVRPGETLTAQGAMVIAQMTG